MTPLEPNEATTPPPAEDGYTYIRGSDLTLESYCDGRDVEFNGKWCQIRREGGVLVHGQWTWLLSAQFFLERKCRVRYLTPRPEPKEEVIFQWDGVSGPFRLVNDQIQVTLGGDDWYTQSAVAHDTALTAIKYLLAERDEAREEAKDCQDLRAEKQALAAKVEELEGERDEAKTLLLGLRMAFDCANADATKAETERDEWRTEACNRGAKIDGLILERARLKTDLGHMIRERDNLLRRLRKVSQPSATDQNQEKGTL